MRKVKVFKWVESPAEGGVWEKEFDYEASFHAFGVDFEEVQYGVGNYSAAIVELDNGEVKNVPAEMIQFLTPPTKQ